MNGNIIKALVPLLLTSCVLFQPKRSMEKYRDGVGDMVSAATDSFFEGLDRNAVDSVANELTQTIIASAVRSANSSEVDSLKFRLSDIIRTGIRDGLLDDENMLTLRTQTGLLLDIVGEKLDTLIRKSGDQLQAATRKNLISLKQELFKDDSKDLVQDLMRSAMTGVTDGYTDKLKPELFELITRIDTVGQRFIRPFQEKAQKFESQAKILAWILAALIVVAVSIGIFLRWKSIRTRMALVAALEAIDEIPSKEHYDLTKLNIQKNASSSAKEEIEGALKKYGKKFQKKKEYQDAGTLGLQLVLKHLNAEKHADIINRIMEDAIKLDEDSREASINSGNKHVELQKFIQEHMDKSSQL